MSTERKLRAALWLGFGLRLIVAVWNGYFGPSFGAEGDASGLHQLATQIAAGEYPEEFRLTISYAYGLGMIYRLTMPSLFLGSLLSCFAWLGSALALLASFRVLRVGPSLRVPALFVYALLPSSILWTAVTMREPFELLMVNVAIYAALRVVVDHHKPSLLLLLAALAPAALFHAAFVGWGAWLVLAVVGLEFVMRPGLLNFKRIAVGAVAVVLFAWFGFRVFTSLYSYPLDRGLIYAVSSYQRGGMVIGARTDYRFEVTLERTADLLTFVPLALGQYLFEPMPWNATSVADLEPVSENILRAILICQAIVILRALPRRERRPWLLILASFLVLETAWALGTFNWGTAARHHIPSMGMLLLGAFAYPLPNTQRAPSMQPREIAVGH